MGTHESSNPIDHAQAGLTVLLAQITDEVRIVDSSLSKGRSSHAASGKERIDLDEKCLFRAHGHYAYRTIPICARGEILFARK